MTPEKLAEIREDCGHDPRPELIPAHAVSTNDVIALLDHIEAQEKALRRCHELLEHAISFIDLEQFPDGVDKIKAELFPCYEANHCPKVKR